MKNFLLGLALALVGTPAAVKRRHQRHRLWPGIGLALPARPSRLLRDSDGEPQPSIPMVMVSTARWRRGQPADCFYIYPPFRVIRDELGSDPSFRKSRPLLRSISPVSLPSAGRSRGLPAGPLSSIPAIVGGAERRRSSLWPMATWSRPGSLLPITIRGPFVIVGHSLGTIHLSQRCAEIEGAQRTGCSRAPARIHVEFPEGEWLAGRFARPRSAPAWPDRLRHHYVSVRATNPPRPVAVRAAALLA